MGARAFEGLKLRNGLLRELGPVQVLGVRCGGQLLLGDATPTDALQEKAVAWPDVEAWVWVDTSSRGRWPSVMKATGPAVLLFPWRRQFLPGFDD